MRLCRLQHTNWQRQSYHRSATWTIGDPRGTAVGLGNRIHKGKSKTVTRGMFSLYESVENLAADIRWESGAIILNH